MEAQQKAREEEAASQTAVAPEAAAAAEREITKLIHRYARLVDEQCFLEWMDLFAEDGVYAAITHENFSTTGLHLFKDRGKRALHERVAFLMGLWQSPRGKTRHLITNLEIEVGASGETAAALSNFLITRTAEFEHASLYACGQYRDEFERRGGDWVFKQRLVIVDSNLLPSEFTEIL
jgi:3-phenylpropionate/cinnamic acid dioxygenase small subunit